MRFWINQGGSKSRSIFFISPISIIISLLALTLLSGIVFKSSARADEDNLSIVALKNYQVSLFARGTKTYTKPDAIVVDRHYVYIAYQNDTAKDGSDGKSSTIVKYDESGKILDTFSVKGHCDGMRLDSSTQLLWVLVNNDANPAMYTLNTKTEEIKSYTFSSAPHGGGYDDLAFVNGMAFISASNPTLNSAGINTFPAVDKVELKGNVAELTPVLYGNATALDLTTNSRVTLNLTDPDSMSVDDKGEVVLVDQADSQLIFLQNTGTPKQSVSRLSIGTQADDTVWTKKSNEGEGRLWVVDGQQNATYIIHSHFAAGTVYTEAPSDSGVASFVGTVDLKSGTITPVAIGFGSPTGLQFVGDANN